MPRVTNKRNLKRYHVALIIQSSSPRGGPLAEAGTAVSIHLLFGEFGGSLK